MAALRRQGIAWVASALCLSLVISLASFQAPAATFTFSNNDDVVMPELTAGPAFPYPSPILVSGLTSSVAKITITISEISHVYPDDLDIILVGPNGGKTYLMSDTGLDNSLSAVTLTFDDAASRNLPDIDPITSGAYRPSNYGTFEDIFPPPAPAGPYPTNLAVFQNINPNGAWSLFAVDDLPEDSGYLSGWQLHVEAGQPIADVAVSLRPSVNPAFVGQSFYYDLIVTNQGPADAAQVFLTNTLPASFTVTSLESSRGVCTLTNRHLECALGTLRLAQTGLVRVLGYATEVGNLTNVAQVAAAYLDLATNNNRVVSFLPVQSHADLSLTAKLPDTEVFHGQTVPIIVAVTNRGPSTASRLQFRLELGSGLGFISATAPGWVCSAQGGNVVCTRPEMLPDQGTELTFLTLANQPQSATNHLMLSADQTDLNPSDNSLFPVVTIRPLANLGMRVSPPVSLSELGSVIPWEIQVTNQGPSIARNVLVHWAATNGIAFLSTTNNDVHCLVENDTVTCLLPDLPPASTHTMAWSAQSIQIGQKTNLLQLVTADADPDLADNAGQVVTTVYEILGPFAQTQPIELLESGIGLPYPSIIEVRGLTTSVFKVTATLSNIFHDSARDLAALLTSPDGTSVLLMGNVGDSVSVTNITLSFDDEAASGLDKQTPLASGTYRPANFLNPQFAFPPPAPAAPFGASLSDFQDGNPNGPWSLFVFNDAPMAQGGIMGGWSLTIAGWSPLTPFSRITSIQRGPGPFTRLEFSGQPGLSYVIDWSEDLVLWDFLGPAQEVSRGHFTFMNESFFRARFYRVRSD